MFLHPRLLINLEEFYSQQRLKMGGLHFLARRIRGALMQDLARDEARIRVLAKCLVSKSLMYKKTREGKECREVIERGLRTAPTKPFKLRGAAEALGIATEKEARDVENGALFDDLAKTDLRRESIDAKK